MSQPSHHGAEPDEKHRQRGMYLRFAAAILTSMVVMYAAMFLGSWEWGHVQFSQSRVFMALTMGGTMGLIMLAWMLGMYKSTKVNIAIVVISILMIGGGVALDRSQATVDSTAFMRGMIPHHSLAITRSERSQLADVRVCELAQEISAAQRREIAEMEWLIADIAENGAVTSASEAAERAVPTFEGVADRTCGAEAAGP
ncbi:DUF305 domain-containing protein [Microbacterium sp. ARD31]|uniref:DUF305 domain-containing protein n=1 Tax=Microbacterium sp. ARD31 TaxID=2962576 RepID=UPI002880FBAE|nr:DUF305 domain-containing protein [Microbacterium sp. ARD31]MDT0184893.1 DUF305 domain-containing protein [Microbacterium sp. ARD31]